jgi:hypothetical protein
MSSGTNNPIFNKESVCVIEGFEGRKFELSQKTWEMHILKDRARSHYKGQFNKIVETLEKPEYILQSPKEEYVAFYVKKFNDLYILNTVTAITYLYICVNVNNNNIRTIYDNPELKGWERIWPKN